MVYDIHYVSEKNMPYGENYVCNDVSIIPMLREFINNIESISIKVHILNSGCIIFNTANYESYNGILVNENTYDPYKLLNKI